MPHKNPNANRAYQRQWARDRRERLVAIGGKRDALLRSRYGLTEAKWEALFQAQGRKCAICATDNPKSKVGWHTDHDHKTGTVRGILCENCNRGLGMYQDDIGFLRKAAAYLGEHQGVFTGEDIRRAAAIQPIEARTVVNGMTHGLGPAGYDIRLDQDLVLKPKGFSLGSAMEYFDIPNDCVAMVFDKSTNARRGLTLFNTIAEPGWRGYLTLELFNASDETIRLSKGDPIAQVVFIATTQPVERPYSGKYQDQARGPQAAILENCNQLQKDDGDVSR